MTTTRLSTYQLRRMVIGRLLAAVPILGAMFFLPAGTLLYWEAWVYMGVLFIPTTAQLSSVPLSGSVKVRFACEGEVNG